MNKPSSISGLLCALLLCSCSSREAPDLAHADSGGQRARSGNVATTDSAIRPSEGARVPLTRVWHDNQSNAHTEWRRVVETQVAWDSAWREIVEPLRRSQVPQPRIDFDAGTLLIATMGERPSTGYDINIDSVTVVDSGAVAWVRSTTPPRGLAGARESRAVDVVLIARIGMPIRFAEGVAR